MKSFFKKGSAVMIIALMVTALSFGLVACNDDKITTETLSESEAFEVLNKLDREMGALRDYREAYSIKTETNGETSTVDYDISVKVHQNTKTEMLGVIDDGTTVEKLYLGYPVVSIEYGEIKYSGIPTKFSKTYASGESGDGVDADEFEFASAAELVQAQNATRNTFVARSLTSIRNSNESITEIVVKANKKNGNLESYSLNIKGTFTEDGKSYSYEAKLTTIAFTNASGESTQGVKKAEITRNNVEDEIVETVKAEFEYGVFFETPSDFD